VTTCLVWLGLHAVACAPEGPIEPPATLAATGLYADAAQRRLAPGVMPFEPQYPLWSDGARKRRWIALPEGTAIDASDVDAWQFPTGTRLWKEFTFADGVETRFMQRRADATWLYATYVRKNGAPDDVLAPACGVPSFVATQNGKHHDVPSLTDCRLCHEGGRTAVLGFSALQLSPDRDPLAPHGAPANPDDLDLTALAARGLLRHLPEQVLATPPRVNARTATERAALGYLHGNCGNCHNASGPLQRLGLRLDHPLAAATPPAIETTFGVGSAFQHRSARARIDAGSAASSLLWLRVAAEDPITQMPPFGRHLVDDCARDLLARWIDEQRPGDTTASSSAHQPPRK
jgi:mono/diheme cytochrome c family protein